jgi:hypothetical protein
MKNSKFDKGKEIKEIKDLGLVVNRCSKSSLIRIEIRKIKNSVKSLYFKEITDLGPIVNRYKVLANPG